MWQTPRQVLSIPANASPVHTTANPSRPIRWSGECARQMRQSKYWHDHSNPQCAQHSIEWKWPEWQQLNMKRNEKLISWNDKLFAIRLTFISGFHAMENIYEKLWENSINSPVKANLMTSGASLRFKSSKCDGWYASMMLQKAPNTTATADNAIISGVYFRMADNGMAIIPPV